MPVLQDKHRRWLRSSTVRGRTLILLALVITSLATSCGDDGDDLRATVDEEAEVGTEDPPVVEGSPDADGSADGEGSDVESLDAESTDESTDEDADEDADGQTATEEPSSNPNSNSESASSDAQPPAIDSADGSGGSGTGAGGAVGAGDGEGVDEGMPDAQVAVDDGDSDDDPAAAGRVDRGFPAGVATDLESGAIVDIGAELTGVDGNVLLWFWSPDSGPSVAEADVVQRLVDENLDLDVVAIGVGGNPETARLFRDETGLRGVTIVWDHTTANAEQYEITTVPSAVLLDNGGDIIGRWTTISPEVLQLLRLLSS